MIPVGLPQVNGMSVFLAEFPTNVQAFLNSGITMGSITAILLNLVLNYWGGRVADDGAGLGRVSVDVAQRDAEGPSSWPRWHPPTRAMSGIAEAVADRRPFADANALRAALQDQLFSLQRGSSSWL